MTAAFAIETPRRVVYAFPDEAILTKEEVALWLGMSEGFVDHSNIPYLHGTGRMKRYSAGVVRAYLEGRLDAYLGRAA